MSEEAERLLREFCLWLEEFASDYVDTTYGGTLAEDAGFKGLMTDAREFFDAQVGRDRVDGSS